MKVSIVIPTYNEEENIGLILDAISKEEKLISEKIDVVIVDGSSTDKTREIVKGRALLVDNIFLITEKEKSGLGAAYVSGMKYSMQTLHADAVVEMDADFQHDPSDIKRLISKLNEGYDYVIGSRYIRGGSIPKSWAFHRKFLSYAGNLFSRLVLFFPETHDITSGFRISRSSLLSKVNLDLLEKKAYTYKIQLLYEMKKAGAKLSEIPIKFGLRDRGDSKMETENILVSLKTVILLRLRDSASFLKFLIVGLLGLFTQTSTFFSMVLVWGADPSFALLPSFILSALVTFSLNNLWSFKERKIIEFRKKISKFSIFFLINVGSYLIQRSCIEGAKLIFKGSVYPVLFIGFPLGIAIGLVWNYTFYSRIVWNKK